MATFVLVHGGWHGAWCWQRVATRLRAVGHDVYIPTLSGHGDNAHRRAADINLSTHITDVVSLLRNEDLGDTVLVGHSYGGNVITGAADAEPSRVTRLVYLDGHVPEDGQSCWDLAPEFRDFFIEGAAESGGIWVPPVPAAMFNVNPADAEMVDRMCVPMSLPTLLERIKLTGAGRDIPKTFVWTSGWNPNPFIQFRDKYADDPLWTIAECPTGHDLMLDDPDLTTRLLLDSLAVSAPA
jgi:pimeloyl-ACP methyl ester carboxylesterase